MKTRHYAALLLSTVALALVGCNVTTPAAPAGSTTVVPVPPPATDTVDGVTPTEKLDAPTTCARTAEEEPE